MARRLRDAGHPRAKDLGVGAHVGGDLLDHTLHPDPACRRERSELGKGVGVPTHAECVGRSVVHHMAHKHGLDPESVRRRIQDMGMDLGETMQQMAGRMGLYTAKRSAGHGRRETPTGATAAASKRAADVQRAGELRAQAREGRMRREGRVLQEEAPPGAVLAEGRVRRAGSLSRSLRNASAVGQHGLMGVDEAAMRSANARLARVSAVPRAIPEPEHLGRTRCEMRCVRRWRGMIALQAEHGSMTDRFSSFIERFNSLRDRWNELNNRRHERARELSEAASRRLSEMPVHPDKLYDALEQAQASARAVGSPNSTTRRRARACSSFRSRTRFRGCTTSSTGARSALRRRTSSTSSSDGCTLAIRATRSKRRCASTRRGGRFDNPDYAHST